MPNRTITDQRLVTVIPTDGEPVTVTMATYYTPRHAR